MCVSTCICVCLHARVHAFACMHMSASVNACYACVDPNVCIAIYVKQHLNNQQIELPANKKVIRHVSFGRNSLSLDPLATN